MKETSFNTFTCDICGRIEKSKNDDKPSYWRHVFLSIDDNGKPHRISPVVDCCDYCLGGKYSYQDTMETRKSTLKKIFSRFIKNESNK